MSISNSRTTARRRNRLAYISNRLLYLPNIRQRKYIIRHTWCASIRVAWRPCFVRDGSSVLRRSLSDDSHGCRVELGRATQLDQYAEFVDQWISQGGRNSAELFRLLQARGCHASYDAVRRYLNRKLGSSGRPSPRVHKTTPPPPPRPTARKLSFAFINPQKESTTSAILRTIRERVPVLNSALNLAEELAGMFRQSITKPLADWLKEAEASEIGELRTFATSLRQDESAIQAAMTEL